MKKIITPAPAVIQHKTPHETPNTTTGARNTPAGGYCMKCSKIAWASPEEANAEVLRIKASPNARKPYLLDAYSCPHGHAFHVGHNFKLVEKVRNLPERNVTTEG